MIVKRRCENCRWWDKQEDETNINHCWGYCHYKSPKVFIINDCPSTRWPITIASVFCSKFKPKVDQVNET